MSTRIRIHHKSILLENPDYIDTLILLGKGEYYLRLFPFSRRRFEIVLTHDPGNFEDYYGLQFFNERKKRIWIIAAWVSSIFLLLFIGILLNISIRSGFNQFEESISEQSRYYFEVEKKLSDRMLGISDNLDQYAEYLEKLKENLYSGIENLYEHLGDLDFKHKEQFSKLEDNQLEHYRNISKEIKDLKEIVGRLENGISAAGLLPSD